MKVWHRQHVAHRVRCLSLAWNSILSLRKYACETVVRAQMHLVSFIKTVTHTYDLVTPRSLQNTEWQIQW